MNPERVKDGSDVPFANLEAADLLVDRVYRGGRVGNVADDPIGILLPVGNQGGIRRSGSTDAPRLVVLYTSGEDRDWPDSIDLFTGTLVYFGDNKRPGRELHDTTRRGNLVLRNAFDMAHGGPSSRASTPPTFVFSKEGTGRDVRFRGIAVPGSPSTPPGDDLVAVWRVAQGSRFQNYRATFTILDEPVIKRSWIDDLCAGKTSTDNCPSTWRDWVDTGFYRPLVSERIDIRTKEEQLPRNHAGSELVEYLHHYFIEVLQDPFAFERCAVDLWCNLAPDTGEVELTRPWRDGGRDALGRYFLGPPADRLGVEFALEAKCYAPSSSVGVREVSRLIARLRHRQFGVFVTTSYFNRQAYEEIRQDGHPVVLICARDIVEILERTNRGTVPELETWLKANYGTG